jgi:REP element-mobilizing transposase RayT
MTLGRSQQVSLEDTPYYHCIPRCVRRAFLCGEDRVTGENYEHRELWVVEKLRELSEVFAIDVCAYAIMSNHYHVIRKYPIERFHWWLQYTAGNPLRRARLL